MFKLSCRVDGLSPASIRDYSYKIGRCIEFLLGCGIKGASEVNTNHIRMFLAHLQESNKPGSVIGYYKSVHRFFAWLVEEEVIEKNPVEKVRPPKVPQKVIQPFQPEHIQKLLSLCDNSIVGLRNKALILLFTDTGIRLREMSDLKVDDIDFDREVVKVMGKGARERFVAISRLTQKALLKYLLSRGSDSAWLWLTEEKKPLTLEGIAQVFKKTLKARSGLKDVRVSPHTFRHTFATTALRNGADIRDVQSLLGHSTLRMTMRYVATVNSEQAVQRHKKWSPVDALKLG